MGKTCFEKASSFTIAYFMQQPQKASTSSQRQSIYGTIGLQYFEASLRFVRRGVIFGSAILRTG